MASLRIEGDLEGVRDEHIKFIRTVLEKRGFKNNRVVMSPAGTAGDNFAANVKRISVIVDDDEDFKFIAKFAPENKDLRQLSNTAAMFNNESLMYEQILPKLVGLQKAADVPEKDWLRYAECYGCLTEEPNEVILLEDLRESKYVMIDKLEPISDETARLILKNFALFHSLSFALKKLQPDDYDKLKNRLCDISDSTYASEVIHAHLLMLEEGALAIVDDKYKSGIRGNVVQVPALNAKLKKSDSSSKYLVIKQGDAWINNILFKFKNDVPAECIMIDFQMTSEANPVSDILYMIFNCTDHKTRQKYYHDWINYYHDQLDRSLSHFGMKANYVYPKDQLDADLKRYSKVFFGLSIMVTSMVTKSTEEAKVLKTAMNEFDIEKMGEQMPMEEMSSNTISLMKRRIEDLIESYRYLGYQ